MSTSDSENLPEIPQKFMQYAEQIRATVKDTIHFKLKPATDLKPWQSKVGGNPYYPLDMEYPCNSKGIPLTFLMQINFTEIPQLQLLPENGILQFFIGQDELMGIDFENGTNQDGFRIIYFDIIEEDESKLKNVSGRGSHILHKVDDTLTKDHSNALYDHSPLSGNCSYSLDLSVKKQYVTGSDYRFENVIPFGNDYEILYDYNDTFPEEGHHIGGYPYFRQSDPREDSELFCDYELLLQLDSDSSSNHDYVMWGDAGVGSFFIHPDDLKKRDFSRVLYYWDCC